MIEANGTRFTSLPRSYADDYAGWIEDTARAIEDGRFSDIDRAALADEVRDLGKTERRELKSALEVLMVHLLKTRYQPERQTRSWQASINVQRKQVKECLDESPSLSVDLSGFVDYSYERARIKAADETGLDLDVFPESCEWTVSELLGT